MIVMFYEILINSFLQAYYILNPLSMNTILIIVP